MCNTSTWREYNHHKRFFWCADQFKIISIPRLAPKHITANSNNCMYNRYLRHSFSTSRRVHCKCLKNFLVLSLTWAGRLYEGPGLEWSRTQWFICREIWSRLKSRNVWTSKFDAPFGNMLDKATPGFPKIVPIYRNRTQFGQSLNFPWLSPHDHPKIEMVYERSWSPR